MGEILPLAVAMVVGPAIGDRMVRYSWLISMIVYGFFILLPLG